MNDKGDFKNKIYKLLKIHTGPVKYVSDKYRYQSNIDGRGGWIFNLENSIYSVVRVVVYNIFLTCSIMEIFTEVHSMQIATCISISKKYGHYIDNFIIK